MRTPAVQAAIQVGLSRQLVGELAPLAFKFCRQVLQDEEGEKFGEVTRKDVARLVIDRAGFVPPRQATGASEDKEPEQMSTDELQAMCAKLEAELAGRARDITPDSTRTGQDLADLL